MSKVDIISTDGLQTKVTLTRTIKLGSKWNIAPSMTYANEYGVVEVTDIVTPQEYEDAPHRFPDITEYLSTYGIDENSSEKDKTEFNNLKDSTLWIVYKYTRVANQAAMGYVGTQYAFSAEEFARHTSPIE